MKKRSLIQLRERAMNQVLRCIFLTNKKNGGGLLRSCLESATLSGHVAFYCCVAHGGHPGWAAGESRQWPSITGLCGVGGAGCVACVLEVMARGPLSLQL